MKFKSVLLGMGLLMVLCSISFAQVPQMINYQGKLATNTGAPVNDTLQIVFTIYADEAGTTPLWTETQSAVEILKGVFNVILGSVNPISYSVFNGSTRYLGVQVGADPEITPRKPIVSVAHAYKSFESDTADYARIFTGTVDNADKVDGFHASATPTAGYLYPLDGSAKIPNARLYTGSGNGLDADLLDGQHASSFLSTTNDYGRPEVAADLYEGTNTLTSKYVNVTGPDGVYTTSGTAFTGSASGSSSGDMYGVRGNATNSSNGYAHGGYFYVDASGTGKHYGVYATSYGSSNGWTWGVKSDANNSSTGNAYGGQFSASNYGGGTGPVFGLSAQGFGYSSAGTYGITVNAENTSSGRAYGASFYNPPSVGTGGKTGVIISVPDSSSVSTYGIDSYAYNLGTGSVYAGYFDGAYAYSGGTQYGVYGRAMADRGWAGYFAGDVRITDSLVVLGGKSAAVKVDNGEYRLLYSQESPEVWFEDFGEGQLINGRANIELDPLFAQTVNTLVTYHVFLTPGGDCNGLYVVNKTPASFEVKELKSGNSNLTFSYRIVAKRKGYENIRLAKMGKPTPEEVALEQARNQAEREEEQAKMEEQREEMRKERQMREQERLHQEGIKTR